jgi:hypothetical protein
MLHFMPVAPLGQVESMPNVQRCEHTGWPTMSNVSVQTPLSHSVDVSLAVTQVAPNARGAGPDASAGAGALPEQAARTNDQARTSRSMAYVTRA